MAATQPSKTIIDRAGRELADTTDARYARSALATLDAWRRMHAEQLDWVAQTVRRRLRRIPGAPIVAHRLKRTPQIIAKLGRAKRMRLTQMQDIGGARAILPSPAAQTFALDRICARSAPHYEVKRVADYRAEGRSVTGYRAIHVIVVREGRTVEVQLRTLRQHAWAEAVERVAERTKTNLKDGDGPAHLVDFFRHASEAFYLLDQEKPVPQPLRRRLRVDYGHLQRALPESIPVDDRIARLIERRRFETVSNYWLIVYNWRTARFEHWADLGTDSDEAASTYAEWERRFPPSKDFEVVLVGADSAQTIQQTHAHYFGRTANDIDPHGVFQEIL